MGLINSYGNNNKVVINGKTVSYSQGRISGKWTWVHSALWVDTFSWMWEYHRYCQMTYSYVGMDLASANACAQALIQQYTRTFYVSVWNEERGEFDVQLGGSMPMAEVAVQQRAGCMYDVVVSIREDDTRLVRVPPRTGPQELFTAENARSYD